MSIIKSPPPFINYAKNEDIRLKSNNFSTQSVEVHLATACVQGNIYLLPPQRVHKNRVIHSPVNQRVNN